MATVRTSGPLDPPQTTTNVVGTKRIRKVVATLLGVGQLTLGDIRSCLPLSTPELRILKISIWGPDGSQISVVFPIGTASNSNPGDNSVWVDEGTTGQQRAQIHLTPCFEYRNFWFLAGQADATLIATFGSTAAVNSNLIVDLTVQYRTAIQTCPALEHLRALQLQSEDEICQELFLD